MALEISKKKAGSAELEALLVEARALLERLSEHADRDVQVFEAYMRALRLPKASESEQTERRAALRAATKVATEAPLMAAEDHLRALVLAARASGSIESNVRSDLYAGADLLLGATKASLRSVDINLPNLDDETLHAEVSARARALAQQTDALHAEILSSAK
ncbi:MAG TPA: cyclodeaminase/cyclohydrolase family protein, partial [Polyangiales bacterium]